MYRARVRMKNFVVHYTKCNVSKWIFCETRSRVVNERGSRKKELRAECIKCHHVYSSWNVNGILLWKEWHEISCSRKHHEGISERECLCIRWRGSKSEREKITKNQLQKHRHGFLLEIWAPHLHLLYDEVVAVQWMRAPCIPNRWCIMLHFPPLYFCVELFFASPRTLLEQ